MAAPIALIVMPRRHFGSRQAQVVTDHPGLAEREAGEHAERVQRDQLGDVAVEDDDQDPGDDGQEDHAVGEHQPVAAVGELPREETVLGDDRRQPREVGVGRVRRQDQDRERRDLHDPEQHALAAVDVLGHQRDAGRVVLAAHRVQLGGQHRDADEARAEDRAHPHQRVRGVLRLRLLERRHAVADRLDARQRHRAGREAAQQHQQRQGAGALGQLGGLGAGVCRVDRAEVADEDADEADDDQQDQRADVDVRRRGEQRAGLLEAAQVGDGHRDDAQQADRHGPLRVEADRGADRQHATGDADGDGEDVVDEQRRAGDERRDRPEVLLGDDVAAATARVGEDRLAVAGDDDHQQDTDDDGDRHELGERRQADPGLADEHDEDLVGRVCRRRDRVAGEHRQGDLLGDPLVALVGRRDRLADEDTFDDRHTPGDASERRDAARDVPGWWMRQDFVRSEP
ncbi:MAG: hypothetical protein QM733_14605 [Ilumatobacteraceae bacterium]